MSQPVADELRGTVTPPRAGTRQAGSTVRDRCTGAGQAALIDGASAARDRRRRAATQALDAVASVHPTCLFCQAQRGYAYGVLANPVAGVVDQASHDWALDGYRAAPEVRSEYVPDLLNAVWLYEQAGAAHGADQLLVATVEHAVDWALPALLLRDGYALRVAAIFGADRYAESMQREVNDVPASLGVFRLCGLPGSLPPSLSMVQHRPDHLHVYCKLGHLYTN